MRLSLEQKTQSQITSVNYRSHNTPSSTHLPLCLIELLEQVAHEYNDKVAILCGSDTITFGELNSAVNGFARVLIQHGIGKNDLVGVGLNRSIDLVAVLLAVMKAGAAYVPIEPAFPVERVVQMMDDACPKLLIKSANTLEEFASRTNIPCLDVDDARSMMNTNPLKNEHVEAKVKPDDLAYVMYTSGSTGRPKGVEVSHGSVANLLLSMQKEPGCSHTDRLLAITTVSFDMAVLELFLPLLCGGTTVIAQRHEIKDMTALVTLMEQHQITIMQGTPAIWQMLLDSGWCGQPRLMKILCGGEALPRALADRLLACGEMMWNLYGPTEATVYASIWQVSEGHDVIIGKPINNGHLYVLDDNLSPVPLGQVGELCIGGAGVARGYHNNFELSRSRFVDNPFHEGLMYRTGDVARFINTEEVSVMGRADGQVKIRGHRIEPGDIEAAITSREDVSGAVVVCRDDRLVAYYVRKTIPTQGGDTEARAEAPLDRILRPWLAERLPAYMVPAFFVELEAFPVTINGKIDRKALPDPVSLIKIRTAPTIPGTDLESQILKIWSKVLGHDRFGVYDNFFEIGGDSLRVVRVQKDLQDLLGRHVPSPTLFQHYTIKALAANLTGSGDAGIPNIPTGQPYVRDTVREDIAIISMACRLPGGVTTPEELWDLLECGTDAITEVPEGRWATDSSVHARNGTQDESYCRLGGFLPSVYSFDTSFFGISPREAQRLDPSQYMMLETCWEAFEQAGYTTEQLRNSSTGVFIGTSNILSHQGLNPTAPRDFTSLDGYTVTGSAAGTMSGRISYQLGLQGPAMTIDTACSSSLVTTHLACNALLLGECDMAVSGGISLMLNPGLHVEFSRLQGMSPDGRCRSFSADTEGTGWSEGCAVVILKRLSDAQRDGDKINAIIRGTAVNHDGRSASLTAPNGHSQQRLIHTALAAARLQPSDVDYIEAHGTGTRLGDPIEATALADVFGPTRSQMEPLYIGSVKSNIGHTQAAAGLVGLLKVTLAVQHGILPQTLHVTKPTPAVDWNGSNMIPVLDKKPWPSTENRQRRAGVSAFGIGGTNAHVIIQEPPSTIKVTDDARWTERRPRLLPFLLSADTDTALEMQCWRLHQYINSMREESLYDLSYSLATTRNHLRRRLVIMAQNKRDLLEALKSPFDSDLRVLSPSSETSESPKIALLFTGQGSQWPGMGKDLCEVYPIFGQAMQEIASLFNTELGVPLLEVMWAEPGSAYAKLLERTDFAQPALFTLEVSLWRLWKSLGVTPDFVLGHSLGELVAAHIAGIMDLPDACRLVASRGRLMQAQAGDYRMVALEASATEVEMALAQSEYYDRVDIALYNTPMQTVVSGQTDAVDGIVAHFARQGRKAKTVVTGHAFHSRYMTNMLAEYQAVAETVQFNPPRLQIISSLDGNLVNQKALTTPEYWLEQVCGAVRFSDGIQSLASHGINIFLELGPSQVLCGMGAASFPDHHQSDTVAWLASLSCNKDSIMLLQENAAQLHLRGVPIQWRDFFQPFGGERIRLPPYAFQRQHLGNNGNNGNNLPLPRTIGSTLNGMSVTHESSRPLHKELGQYEFQIEWHSPKIHDSSCSGTWGLVVSATDDMWAKSVTDTLIQSGVQLVQVEHVEHAQKLEGLICLWDSEPDVVSGTRDLVSKALSQLQAAAQTQFTPPLVWITRHAVGTGMKSDDDTMKLGVGPLLWGLMRTARSEHPELNLRLIDLGQGISGACIPSALMLNTEPECVVRKDRLLVPRIQRVKPIPETLMAEPRFVRTDGAVLITGGLGHLGSRVARWLADCHNIRDLVLTSRHGMKSSSATELVHKFSSLGVKVTIIASNIADKDDVSRIMQLFSKDRPLRGVVHAAGVVDSGVLSSMTQDRCEITIAPKAHGAWLLHQATKHMDLDIFLMLSSISGVLGMQGLANYAAANTFLDALAHYRCAQGLPATSIALGTMAGDGGMASRLGRNTLSHLAQFGLDSLSVDQGLKLMESAVISKRALTVAAVLDLERLRHFLEQHGGVISPLLTLLLPKRIIQGQNSLSKQKSLAEMLSEANSGQQADLVLSMVRKVVAKTLGFADYLGVEVDRPLKDIGIDSLTAVQIRNQLATLTGLKLSVNIAFIHPNLKALSQYLLSQLEEASSASTIVPSALLDMDAIRSGCLDSGFKFGKQFTNDSPDRFTRPPESVFLTGATGFVGAFILHELLNKGIFSHCLVRADSMDQARQRLKYTLQDYDLWKPAFEPLIQPVIGDMNQPLLGLTEETFEELASKVDTICHSGALVDWMRPLEDYIGPNIVSAHEVLRLASRGRRKSVHLISTISTLPKHMGIELKEGDLEYGYGTSKYIAEKMVTAARWRGATASIYRLPYVTASTATGHFRQDQGDFLHNLIKGCLEMGNFPLLDADLSAVLPVDYLAKTVVALMTTHLHSKGRDYDFLNTRAPSCSEFFNHIVTLSSGRMKGEVPFSAWKKQALAYAIAHPKSSLARITAVLDNYTNQNASSMFKGLSVGEHVLGGDYYPAPAIDENFVKEYLQRINE